MIPAIIAQEIQDADLSNFTYRNLTDKKNAWIGSEHDLQKQFMQHIARLMQSDPLLYLIHAIPNGGQRNKIEAVRLKAEGVKSGIPDICVPIPKGGFNGMYIEFKNSKGVISADQDLVLRMLGHLNFYVVVVDRLDVAIEELEKYLDD